MGHYADIAVKSSTQPELTAVFHKAIEDIDRIRAKAMSDFKAAYPADSESSQAAANKSTEATNGKLQNFCQQAYHNLRLWTLHADRRMKIHLQSIGITDEIRSGFIPNYDPPSAISEGRAIVTNRDSCVKGANQAVDDNFLVELRNDLNAWSAQLEKALDIVTDQLSTCPGCFTNDFQTMESRIRSKVSMTYERLSRFTAYNRQLSEYINKSISAEKCVRFDATLAQKYDDLMEHVQSGADDIKEIAEFYFVFLHVDHVPYLFK